MENSGSKSNEDSPANSVRKTPAHRFELGTLATNRILFALALLGVIIPLNSIAIHFHQIDFTYFAPRNRTLKGPFHVRAINFFYFMEISLAAAVYFYGFGFIFKWSIPDRIGTVFYACALLMPLLYGFIGLFSTLQAVINNLNTFFYWVVGLVFGAAFTVLIIAFIMAVIMRIGD